MKINILSPTTIHTGVTIILAALLMLQQGCSVTPTGKATTARPVTPKPAATPPATKPVKVQPQKPSGNDVSKEMADCVFRPSKGIAELLAVEDGKWLMRFHPGDIPFVHQTEPTAMAEATADDNSPGLEFRALMYTRDSGPCDHHYFELLGTLQ